MKILVADDSGLIRLVLQRTLVPWGYEVVVAEDGEKAWRVLQQPDCPRIALVDWMMPGLSGLEICRRVRAAKREPYIFIILLTGKEEQQDIVEGLAAGADDYLKKPFDRGELQARINTGRRMAEFQAELTASREGRLEQATIDPLTGVPNRRTILDTLDKELARSRRAGGSCAMVFVDLDHFKRVNDAHGHAAGDAVLKQAAASMRSTLRPYDVLGRYGGEEFIVVLPGCDAEGARSAAERLRAAVASAPVIVGTSTLRVTCSAGVVARGSGSDLDRDALMAATDAALLRAKTEGRDRVVVGQAGNGPKRQKSAKKGAAGETPKARRPPSRKR